MLNLHESKINLFLQKKSNKTIITFFKIISNIVIFTYPLILISVYLKKKKMKYLVLFKIGMILVILLKKIIGRPRPYIVNTNIKQYDMSVKNCSSFPSGHAFSAFYIMLLFKNDKVLKIISYMIIFSRLILGVHYISDIIASYFIVKFFFYYT